MSRAIIIGATVLLALIASAYIPAILRANAQMATCIAKVPHLAKRLHVSPGNHGGGLALNGCDGKQYDLFAMIEALLDRADKMEKASR